MTFEEIEEAAWAGKRLGDAGPLERLCFQCMSELYRSFRSGETSHEKAKEAKNAIRRDFETVAQDHGRCVAAYAQYQQNIRAAGERWNDLPKRSKTMGKNELIAELLAIVSAMVGEDVTAEAVRKAALI